MEDILHVFVGNKKTGEMKWDRYPLEGFVEDEGYLRFQPEAVSQCPEFLYDLTHEGLGKMHEDPASHRIWIAVIDQSAIPDAIDAMQDAIGWQVSRFLGENNPPK